MGKKEFLVAFDDCFDKNGNRKLSGREKCKALIQAAKEINPEGNFGNIETGFTNELSLKKLKKELEGLDNE